MKKDMFYFLQILFSGVIVFVVMCKLPDADKALDWPWQGTWNTGRHGDIVSGQMGRGGTGHGHQLYHTDGHTQTQYKESTERCNAICVGMAPGQCVLLLFSSLQYLSFSHKKQNKLILSLLPLIKTDFIHLLFSY